jgi:hypothetical protein
MAAKLAGIAQVKFTLQNMDFDGMTQGARA